MSSSVSSVPSSSSSSSSCLVVFVCGDQSGVGKSSLCMGLLASLLSSPPSSSSSPSSPPLPPLYSPHELAYIKPCTQCEDVQLVSKYCVEKGITHRSLGPVIFSPGYTQQDIDEYIERQEKGKGKEKGRELADELYENRLNSISVAVSEISVNKRFVLVDGVGYPSVGSVCGVSNAAVAKRLGAPVLAVGRGGIGNAIDAMNYIISYFSSHSVRVLGGVFNKIPFHPHRLNNYHSYDRCEEYVRKYYDKVKKGESFHCYGFIPLIEKEAKEKEGALNELASPPPVEDVVCILRPAKKDLEMSEEEEEYVKKMIEAVKKHFDVKLFLDDIKQFYQEKEKTRSN